MRVEFNPDHDKARVFFERVLSLRSTTESASLAVVTHLVDSAISFVPALARHFDVALVLGKPSSIQKVARQHIAAVLPDKEFVLDKDLFRARPQAVFREALPPLPRVNTSDHQPIVLLDIGGYFTPPRFADGSWGLIAIRDELAGLGYRLAGIVEDTENGHKRYEETLAAIEGLDFNVYSVARSPLKKPENHLVGVAVTFSVEAILRQSNQVLQSRRAGVIGFGPIGRSVAHTLRGRGIPVSICERDPIKLAQAAAQGFQVYDYEHHFSSFVRDINLVISATGAGASGVGVRPLNDRTVRELQNGTFVASVTSADDELDLAGIQAVGYHQSPLSYNDDVSRWTLEAGDSNLEADYFYLMLGGNAVNFRHEGVVGPAIQLLQGEIMACIARLLDDDPHDTGKVQELSEPYRQSVARMWLDQYLIDSAVIA